ncbi:MAG TPA: PhzF family phenazine biosynthesis protein [Firmicutes bacterium]|nr:PhzF family phenazine biosynthesis protein [Bacillota bacterium]
MSEREFYLVDVFAEEKYAGNQLAVFTQGHLYTDAEMQKLTKEMNYSESTFIFPAESAGNTFKVRIFTPAREVPFAGHPTLGTAYVILKEFVRAPVPEVVLDLKVGKIPVAVSYTAAGEIADLVMKQVEPTFGPTVDAAGAAAVLSLPAEAVDTRYPVQEVSTGLPFLIVPLTSLAHVRAAQVNLDRLAHLWERLEARGILVFAPETYTPEGRLNVRVFVHYLGVPEDPATGSGNGCLAGYLVQHNYFGTSSIDIKVEQGYEIGRPSALRLKGHLEDGHINVYVGGRVVPVAKGRLL